MESFYIQISVYTKQGIALKVSSDWLLKLRLSFATHLYEKCVGIWARKYCNRCRNE